MHYSKFESADTQSVVDLFFSVFGHSEGNEEGLLISELVARLISTTACDDLMGFVAKNETGLVGCIFFSRFSVPNDQLAFILSPVAVATAVQSQGVGLGLINYGIEHLKQNRVELVFTYGDPAYYSKFGFQQIDEHTVKAPFKLSQPIGWLAQSLNGEPIQPMQGVTGCVEALSDAKYW